MMKKLIALLAVSTLVLSGCTWFQPAEEAADDTAPAIETPAGEAYEYENAQFGFSLTFPADWGKVKESGTNSTLDLSSEDGSKDLTMLFMPVSSTAGMDAPSTKLGENDKYVLYREVNQGIDILEGQGEDMTEERALEAELDDIFDTLEITDLGTENLIYKDEALEFEYPDGWTIDSQKATFEDAPYKSVVFVHEDDENITVNFNQPIMEAGLIGWMEKEKKSLNIDEFNVTMQILEEDPSAEVRLIEKPEGMASLTLLEDKSGDYASSYQFYLVAPAKDFNTYNEFVETALDSFVRYQEGGGGVRVD